VDPHTVSGTDPNVKVVEEGGRVSVHITVGPELKQPGAKLVTTELLGKAKIPGLPYENPDGSPLKVDADYLGKQRNPVNPSAGPFENPGTGAVVLKVW
jgi:alpha-N-arabinofuranosidase